MIPIMNRVRPTGAHETYHDDADAPDAARNRRISIIVLKQSLVAGAKNAALLAIADAIDANQATTDDGATPLSSHARMGMWRW